MKLVRTLGLLSTVGLVTLGAGLWMGCGGDDSTTTPGTDAGGKDTSVTDSGGGPDTSPGTDSGQDASGQDAAIGLDCPSYCTAMGKICTGANQQYLDNGTCLKMCATLTVGDAGAMSGDNLACRVYHASVASQSAMNATTHCPHAGPYGFGQCGGECEDFCARYASGCSMNTSYGNTCVTTCNTFMHSDGGVLDPTSAPTINCREYHLENAYANDGGGGHCDHASKAGGGVCK